MIWILSSAGVIWIRDWRIRRGCRSDSLIYVLSNWADNSRNFLWWTMLTVHGWMHIFDILNILVHPIVLSFGNLMLVLILTAVVAPVSCTAAIILVVFWWGCHILLRDSRCVATTTHRLLVGASGCTRCIIWLMSHLVPYGLNHRHLCALLLLLIIETDRIVCTRLWSHGQPACEVLLETSKILFIFCLRFDPKSPFDKVKKLGFK